jgi:hypothetical protein
LSCARAGVPSSRYWVPALLFVAFSLYEGVYQPGIDIAAHVAGLVAGFLLGLVLAQSPTERRGFPAGRAVAAAVVAGALALPPLLYLDAFNRGPSAIFAFTASHRWYTERETDNLLHWDKLASDVSSGSISGDDAANQFENDLLPFWKEADRQFQNELNERGRSGNPLLLHMANFAKLHVEWGGAVIAALRDPGQEKAERVQEYAQEMVIEQAAIDHLKMRSYAEDLPAPLRDSAIAERIGNLFAPHPSPCITAPPTIDRQPAGTDAPGDGPAARHAAGCLGQRLFMNRDYAALDATIKQYERDVHDLPDGSSRLQGLWQGLDDLFSYGRMPIMDGLRRTSEWRRSTDGSAEADIAEALLFRAWAYAARGHGYAASVSPEAMQLYVARAAMAGATLEDSPGAGASDPMWFALSEATLRDESAGIDKQRALFDKGAKSFPFYLPLYDQMLISLMPRWGGSIKGVEQFIRDAATKDGQVDPATYAQLYIIYGNLEGGDFNAVGSADSDPNILRQGMLALRRRYPKSDYILNSVARFACIDNEWANYSALRPALDGHASTTAWPDKLSLQSCNKWAG